MILEMDAQIGHRPDAPLHRIDMRAAPGDIVLVQGPNGAGKSTLLATIAGLRKPLSGRVVVDGHRASARRAKRHIGYVTDPPYLFEELTPGEHLDLVASLWTAVAVPMHGMGMSTQFVSGVPERSVSMLSLGQRKRVGIALAMLHAPRLWVLDEPFNGLDAAGAHTLRSCIDEHLAGGGTVVCATHDRTALRRDDATVLEMAADGVEVGF